MDYDYCSLETAPDFCSDSSAGYIHESAGYTFEMILDFCNEDERCAGISTDDEQWSLRTQIDGSQTSRSFHCYVKKINHEHQGNDTNKFGDRNYDTPKVKLQTFFYFANSTFSLILLQFRSNIIFQPVFHVLVKVISKNSHLVLSKFE